jgi:hypothetical protein
LESIVYTLARCRDWKVFVTLTWSGEPPTSAGQRRLLFAHLYRISRTFRIPFRRLLWVVRQEQGEKTLRPHYHALIGWRGEKASIGQCFALNSDWQKISRSCGWARHYVYNPGEDAANYITKGLSVGLGDFRLAESNYEAGKFGWSQNDVTLSAALVRLIGRAQRLNGETRNGLSAKIGCENSRPANATGLVPRDELASGLRNPLGVQKNSSCVNVVRSSVHS